jgi:signal peptidase II
MVRASVPVHDSITVIPGFLDITHALNSGAAFGILNGADFPYKTVIIAVIATAALIGVGVYAASLSHHQLIARIGLALIIGGAAGNLIDRIRSAAGVVDFIDIGFGDVRFWTFNLADSAVTVGALVLAWSLSREERETALAKAAAERDAPRAVDAPSGVPGPRE